MALVVVNVSYLELVLALACFVVFVVIPVSFEGVLLVEVVLRTPKKGKIMNFHLDNLIS